MFEEKLIPFKDWHIKLLWNAVEQWIKYTLCNHPNHVTCLLLGTTTNYNF